jgi:cupin fold WbuC family metalloprotein
MFAIKRGTSTANASYLNAISTDDYRNFVTNECGLSRICLHERDSPGPQMMLIKMGSNCVYPAHSHAVEREWYVIVEGELILTTYQSDDLRVVSERRLSKTSGYLALTIDAGCIHEAKSGELGAVFFEVRPGPFLRDNTKFYR